jgi:hypothetical protein
MQSFLLAPVDRALALLRRQPSMFSPTSLVMYVLALVFEVPVILARVFLATLVAIVVLELQRHPNGTPAWLRSR